MKMLITLMIIMMIDIILDIILYVINKIDLNLFIILFCKIINNR